ncbi:PH domain-containing protein [Yarrowia sp. B02]|nr:PH domain-containing protein [Yarrowia sp. B02]
MSHFDSFDSAFEEFGSFEKDMSLAFDKVSFSPTTVAFDEEDRVTAVTNTRVFSPEMASLKTFPTSSSSSTAPSTQSTGSTAPSTPSGLSNVFSNEEVSSPGPSSFTGQSFAASPAAPASPTSPVSPTAPIDIKSSNTKSATPTAPSSSTPRTPRALASLNLFDDDTSSLGQSPPIDTADYILPQYSTALFLQARIPVKFEFTSPFTSSSQRAWIMCLVTLNSTCLELKPLDEPFLVNKPTLKKEQQRLVIGSNEVVRNRSKSISLKPSISNLKQVLKESSRDKSCDSRDARDSGEIPQTPLAFTLQYAVCGHAADYTKRANCLRVRAESMQFLIQFGSPQDCIEWANAIQSGIDLSLPLEHRELPKVRSLPRRRRDRGASQRQRAYSTVAPASETAQEGRSRSKSTSSIGAFRLFANLRRPRGNSTSDNADRRPSETGNSDRRPSETGRTSEAGSSAGRGSHDRHETQRGSGERSSTERIGQAGNAPPYTHSNSSVHSHMSDDASVHSSDSFSSDMDSATSSATTMSRSSHEQTSKERWDPEVEQMSEQAELKYATRCLKRFQRYSSWVNKITICEEKPYLVRQNFVQLVANECLVTES